jgi:hypothetical protein
LRAAMRALAINRRSTVAMTRPNNPVDAVRRIEVVSDIIISFAAPKAPAFMI